MEAPWISQSKAKNWNLFKTFTHKIYNPLENYLATILIERFSNLKTT